MERSANRLLAPARTPILIFLIGVGFVVQAMHLAMAVASETAPASVAGRAAGVWVDDFGADQAIHPAPGGSALLSLSDAAGAGLRVLRVPTADAGGRGPSRIARPRLRIHRSPEAAARAVAARDGLTRAGRLSAPATAPPTSPF